MRALRVITLAWSEAGCAMRKLVGANLARLWKNKCFWLCMGVMLAIVIMAAFAFSAVYTFINVLLPNRAFSALISILLFFALLFAVMKLDERLFAPATVFQDIVITGEEIEFREPMPNPRYVDGWMRKAMDFAIDFLPVGQMYRVAYLWVKHPVRMLCSSVFLGAFLTFLGIYLFERKELK